MKKVWISALQQDPEAVQKIIAAAQACGLSAVGHFWVDDVKRMAWSAPLEELRQKETVLWAIVAGAEELKKDTVRFGLGLLTLAVQSRKGIGFPILLISAQGKSAMDASVMDASVIDALPTPLRAAEPLALDNPALGAKIAARAGMPGKGIEPGYHLYLHPLPGIGLWMEVGPAKDLLWQGAMVGVRGGEIDFHGIGPADSIPERCTLEYPFKGMKLRLREKEFVAWGVQNKLDGNNSYFVRIQGMPEAILFGSCPGGDEADVHVLNLY